MAEGRKAPPISFFNSRFISIISISFILFLMGVFFIIGWQSNRLPSYMKENITFMIALKDGLQDADVKTMEEDLNKLPFIKSVKFISKEDAAKIMEVELGEDPQVFIGFNPFQATFETKLHAEYLNSDSLLFIEKKLASYKGVTEIIYQKDAIQIVNQNEKKLGLILLVLNVILLLITFALITNTVRLLIYSKRFLIYTMRLVGATPRFIRRPFIIHSAINGFFAGIIAIIMLSGALYLIIREFEELKEILVWNELFIILGIILALGIFVSVLGAHYAVSRYLKMKQGKMYYI